MLLSSLASKEINDILSFQRREKGSKTKSSVPCPKVAKLYNNSMGGADLMDQHTAAYRLDRKSFRFYLRIFFDLMNIAFVNSYLICNMKDPNKLPPLDYKILVAKNLIQYHQGPKRLVPMSRPSKRKNQPESIDNHGGHLPDYQAMGKGCAYYAMESKENRTFVICLTCNISLCLVKERNCFQKHHLGVNMIYTLYIFAKTLWSFIWPSFIPTASLSFLYIYFSTYIWLYSVFCALNVHKLSKRCNFRLEVIKIIPTNQLILCLICHFN